MQLTDLRPLRLALGAAGLILGLAADAALAVDACPRVTHAGTNFSGQDLRDRNFSNQNLTGANFTKARLQGANFTGANLTAADFTGAEMGLSTTTNRSTNLSRAELTNACFYTATVSSSDFQFANLPCTVFDDTDLSQARFGPVIKAANPSGACRTSFQNAVLNCELIPQWKDLELNRANVQACFEKLAGVDFSNARMDGVIFSGINLSESRWVGARLQGAFFLHANLKKAVLTGANLRRAQLSQADASGARLDGQVQLSGAHLSGAVLKGADLTGAVLQGADGLPAADLALAFMPDAILTDAKMTGVNLSHANFYGALAKADNATLQQVDFSNANLGSVNLTQGRLKGAKMDAATLVNAVLVGADLTTTPDLISSSLVQANLQGADFSGARLAGANLSNAAVSLAEGVVLFKAPVGLTGDLDRRELSAEVVTAFTGKGYHLVDCEDPGVLVDQAGSRWEVRTGSPIGPGGSRFKKFSLASKTAGIEVRGLPDTGEPKLLFTVDKVYAGTLDKKLLAGGLLAAFGSNAYPLPPCVNPEITVKTAGSRWTLDESPTSVTAAGLGYTGFNLILEGANIQTYGSEVTVIRRDDDGSLTLVPIPLKPTALAASAFDNNTTCPNQRSYGANVQSGATWKEMMTAVSPPPPPPCIPSPTRWCN
jgi:uncharacterized protein YjbI with pentapeptide repeats